MEWEDGKHTWHQSRSAGDIAKDLAIILSLFHLHRPPAYSPPRVITITMLSTIAANSPHPYPRMILIKGTFKLNPPCNKSYSPLHPLGLYPTDHWTRIYPNKKLQVLILSKSISISFLLLVELR